MTEIRKDEPATKEDVETLRREMHLRFEQNSQEHGAIVTSVNDQNKATRAHIGSEVGVVAKEMRFFKNFQERMLNGMKRFLTRMGIGSDDL